MQHLTLMTAPFLLDTEVNPFHPQSHHNATGFTILFKPSACSSWLHSMQGKNQKWFTLRDQRSRVWLWLERNRRRPFTLGTPRSQCPGTANAPHSSQKWGAWSPGSPRMEMEVQGTCARPGHDLGCERACLAVGGGQRKRQASQSPAGSKRSLCDRSLQEVHAGEACCPEAFTGHLQDGHRSPSQPLSCTHGPHAGQEHLSFHPPLRPQREGPMTASEGAPAPG